jgi:CHAT domain-containing protein
LHVALKTYELADSVFQEYQNNLAYDDPKLANLEARPISYEDMAKIASSLFHSTGKEEYLEDLFHLMEQSRSSVLKSALSKAAGYLERNIPDSLRMQEKRMQQERTHLVSMAAGFATDKTKSDSIAQAVLDLDRKYQQFLTQVREKDPGYALVRRGLNGLPLRELKQLMAAKSGLWIEYLWGKDDIYVLGVDASGVKSLKIRTSPQLLKSIQWLTMNSRTTNDSTFTKPYFRRYCEISNSLYGQLLAPLIKGKTPERLIICPDGPLSTFPFDVLIAKGPRDDEIDYHLDYLIKEFAISYHFSSAYLQMQAASERHGDRLMALGYGGADPQQPGALAGLPGTLEEISTIEKIMGGRGNTYLLDNDASERSFKSKAGQYNILHLAVHGVADTVNAMNSKLVFRTGGKGEDGELFAYELYGLNLDNMDLAVLSACESGTGKDQPGEGIMSMARGFAYAQCPSLVMSLWKINDRTSANVMGRFYNNLKDGHDIDESLAQAKRDYLQASKTFQSHPSYWAAFISMGETKGIGGTRWPWVYILPAVGLFTMGFFFFRFMSNKKNPARARSLVSGGN